MAPFGMVIRPISGEFGDLFSQQVVHPDGTVVIIEPDIKGDKLPIRRKVGGINLLVVNRNGVTVRAIHIDEMQISRIAQVSMPRPKSVSLRMRWMAKIVFLEKRHIVYIKRAVLKILICCKSVIRSKKLCCK